jgi:o-succinylbenzoate synthase
MISIDQIDLQRVCLPLLDDRGRPAGERRVLLVKLQADGVTGHGECLADERAARSGATLATSQAVLLEAILPALVGRRFGSARELAAVLPALAHGHPMAKAAIETAAWDLEARLRGLPLARLLGGERDAVEAGVELALADGGTALLEQVARRVEEGHGHVLLRLEPGGAPEPALSAIRARFPSLALSLDANRVLTPADREGLTRLDALGLAFLEQPYAEDELLALAELQRETRTPVCLDESVDSPARCAVALRLESGRMLNLHPARVGGHAAALAIHEQCRAAGIALRCGPPLQTAIGRAHALALATLPGFTAPNTLPAAPGWQHGIAGRERSEAAGRLAVPTAPGIGVEVDEELLAALQESSWELTADPFSFVPIPAHAIEPPTEETDA